MNKHWLFAAFLALPTFAWSEELAIPGAGPTETVTRLLAKAFNARQRAHRVTVPKSAGTASAVGAIEKNESVLARTHDRQDLEALAKRGMHFIPFGADAVVFIVSDRVAIRSFTTRQLADIFSGRVTDWRELGQPAGPILVVYRESTASSLQVIRHHLEPFRTLVFAPDGMQMHRDFEVLNMLDGLGTGIGFAARSNLSSAATAIHATALDGVEPTPENVASGRYRMTLRFGFLHKSSSLSAGARAFLAFVASSEGRAVTQQAGVVPLEHEK